MTFIYKIELVKEALDKSFKVLLILLVIRKKDHKKYALKKVKLEQLD